MMDGICCNIPPVVALAAAERSVDPTPLDPAIVARILSAKRTKALAGGG